MIVSYLRRTSASSQGFRIVLFLIGTVVFLAQGALGQWLQWGGPQRDFSSDATGLAETWPEEGPEVVWRRPLGEHGHSSILVEGSRLYTLVRRGDKDVVVALDTASGETAWETEYEAPPKSNQNLQFGPGPHSTPLIAGNRIFTVSATVKLHCLDKEEGKVLWSRDLGEDMGASHMGRGYGSSPLAYGDTVIVGIGGKDTGIAAFRQDSGELVWKGPPFNPSYSSPILIRIDGEEQVVVAMGNRRAGLDPKTGEAKWTLELPATATTTMSTQLWIEDENLLFGSSAYADGSRVIRIRKSNGEFEAEEVWYSRQMRIMYANAVRLGDYIYGSSGDFGPAFLAAIHVKTGELGFRQRGFSRAQLLRANDKLIILDEEGDLAIGTPSPSGIEIHARANVLERTAWTVPTLVGTRLYVRNRSEILALELGS